MWRPTLAGGVLFLLSAEYSVVMCWTWPGTLVTWPWLRLSMIYCCGLRLWSQICVTCRSCWLSDSVALSCCTGARCLGPVGWWHTNEMVTEHFAIPNLIVVVAKFWFLGFVVWDRTFCVQSLPLPWPRWPEFFIVYYNQLLPCSPRISVPLSCLFVIWMPSSGVVVGSVLWPVAISWLSAQPMHMVEHLTFWCLMFPT